MSNIPLANSKRTSYENFEGQCPHCGKWSIQHIDMLMSQHLKCTVEVIGREHIGDSDLHSQFLPRSLQLLQLRR